MERSDQRSGKSYLGEAVLALLMYYFGIFISGLVLNIIFINHARQDQKDGVPVHHVGCLYAVLAVHIVLGLTACIAFFATNGPMRLIGILTQ
jgi:hypothetical protein